MVEQEVKTSTPETGSYYKQPTEAHAKLAARHLVALQLLQAVKDACTYDSEDEATKGIYGLPPTVLMDLIAFLASKNRDSFVSEKVETVDGFDVRPVLLEVMRAIRKFPTWPTDPLHALAVLGEEFGELTKAMVQLTYEPHKTSTEEVQREALQTAAMALRLCHSLNRYEYKPGVQHEQ